MLGIFNKNYDNNYTPLWMHIKDDNINQYFLGILFLPRQLQPSCNEFSIANGDQGQPVILWIKLQEEKQHPVDNNNKLRNPSKLS